MIEYAFANLTGKTTYISDSSIAYRGTWSTGSTYAPPVDVVDYNNGKFIVLVQNSATPPLNSPSWAELVTRGTISPTDPFAISQTALDTANSASTLALAAYNLAASGSNVPFSSLPGATVPLAGTELVALFQSGTEVQTPASNVGTVLIQQDITGLQGGIDHQTLAFAHNLGRSPIFISCVFVCINGDSGTGMHPGDSLDYQGVTDLGSNLPMFAISFDSTNFYYNMMSSNAEDFQIFWNGSYRTPNDVANFKLTLTYH